MCAPILSPAQCLHQTSTEWRDCTASLCACLEAIFLHGLKDAFVWQTSAVLASTAAPHDRRPEPNFWPPLLVYTHRNTIADILRCGQLHTDIGRCRAWIRVALNDGLLGAHFASMRTNRPQHTLRPYYRAEAFVRDADRMSVAERLVLAAGAVLLQQQQQQQSDAGDGGALAVNTSLLDRWPDRPLQLAGLYAPAQRLQPVSDLAVRCGQS